MKKQKTIFRQIFLSFFLLVALTLSICIGVFYSYSARLVRERTSDELRRTAVSVRDQLDSMIRSMDQLSLQIVSTQSLAREFSSLQKAAQAEDSVTLQSQSGTISQMLYSMLGAWTPQQRQINVISSDGVFIGTSSMAVYQKLDSPVLQDSPWLDEAMELGGLRYVTGVHPSLWGRSREPVLSLVRQLSVGTNRINAVLEVQQRYTYLEELMDTALRGMDSHAYIIAENGTAVYPQTLSDSDAGALLARTADPKAVTISDSTGRYIQISEKSPLTGWTLILLKSEKTYLAPLAAFRFWAAGICVLLLAIALLLSYYVAKKIADPIRQMHRHLSELPLESLDMEIPAKSELNELEELYAAFESTCRRMEGLLDELVASRSYEIQARLLALESQMNPHFMYNTISVFHAVADEHDDQDIVDMCEDLSQMLRYTMHPVQGSVPMAQELEYTEHYLRLMKRRFEQNFRYEIQAEPESADCQIPKLSIQPLVENCFKHGESAPPWFIRITVKTTEDTWQVCVEDNGSGFSEEKLRQFTDLLAQETQAGPVIQAAGEAGIGLTNIARRLRLMFREDGGLTVGRSELGGAMVTIFGRKEPVTHE